MVASSSHDLLIRRLARDLEPVRRLVSPRRQILLWLGCLLTVAVPLALTHEPATLVERLGAVPEICLGLMSSMLTALLGAAAAFMLSRPDRPRIWALLPTPAAALWIVIGAVGCLRHGGITDADGATPIGTGTCFFLILGTAVPISALLMVLVRRGYPLRPELTSLLCGLAGAAAAATITNIVHPHDAGASHLALHGLLMGAIVISNCTAGYWVLNTK
jgi:hypothetical protein